MIVILAIVIIGLFQFISAPPLLRNRNIPWGEGIFSNGKFHGGRHFWTGNSKEGVKNTYKMLEIPWEGVNSVGNSMGGR